MFLHMRRDDDEDKEGARNFRLEPAKMDRMVEIMQTRLPVFRQSVHLEVQERVLLVYIA